MALDLLGFKWKLLFAFNFSSDFLCLELIVPPDVFFFFFLK